MQHLGIRVSSPQSSLVAFYGLADSDFTARPFLAVPYGLGIGLESLHTLAGQVGSDDCTTLGFFLFRDVPEGHAPTLAAKKADCWHLRTLRSSPSNFNEIERSGLSLAEILEGNKNILITLVLIAGRWR